MGPYLSAQAAKNGLFDRRSRTASRGVPRNRPAAKNGSKSWGKTETTEQHRDGINEQENRRCSRKRQGRLFGTRERPSGEEPLLVATGGIGLIACRGFVAMDSVEDLAPMNRYLFGGLYPQANLVSSDFYNDDRNVVVDDDAFVLLAG